MSESVRCWLVERSYDDRGLVTVVYATPDGERFHRRELSSEVVKRSPVTAAREIDEEDLEPVAEAERRKRYAAEADRMADRHDPGDEV